MEGNIDILVKELCKLPKETGWVEFKHNNMDPIMIGEDICALANTATLKDRDFAYMVWGVDDTTHDIVGTSARLTLQKRGQEELENWLRHQLSRNANFEFLETEINGNHVEHLIPQPQNATCAMFQYGQQFNLPVICQSRREDEP